MTCTHRWLIPTPDGRHMLPAECKKCGAQTVFPASSEYEYVGQAPLTLKGSIEHAKPRHVPGGGWLEGALPDEGASERMGPPISPSFIGATRR